VTVRGDAGLLDFWCGFAGISILRRGIAVLQNQVVCGISKFSDNFNAVCGFSYVILCGFVAFLHLPPPPYALLLPLCIDSVG